MCLILYLPLAFIFTSVFIIIDIILVPLSYFKLILAFIQTITDSDETMDELHEKLNRVYTIFKFILFGPFILTFSIFVDTINFFMNLFYEPILTVYKENKG
jgi:hypothetical protein